MNPYQMAQQIKHRLQTITWPGGSTDVVFGARGVAVFAGLPTEEQIPVGFPWALVGIEGGEPDDEDETILNQRFNLVWAANVGGDPLGEHALIGGAVADLGKSAGRGVAELANRVRAAVGHLVAIDGAQVTVGTSSTGSPAPFGRGRHLALDEMSLEAICTAGLHYAAPQVLIRSGSVFSWSGAQCSERFDFLQYRIVEKAGSFSADPSDGTVVSTGTADTGVDVTTVIGGRYYTVFADYNSRGGSTVEGSSDPLVGSYVAV